MHYSIKSNTPQSSTESFFEPCQDFIIKMGFVHKNVCFKHYYLERRNLHQYPHFGDTLNKIKTKLIRNLDQDLFYNICIFLNE